METTQQSSVEPEENEAAADKAIAKMDTMIEEARKLVEGTDAIFERMGIPREEMAEIAMKTGVAALGAQMRREEAAVEAPPKRKKKRPTRARMKL